MGQTKGIAIRIDNELLKEIENHNLGRNDLVIQAIKSYLHESNSKTKSSSKKKEKSSSTWSEIEENSEKLKNISKKTSQPKTTQLQKTTTESLTDDLYNEVYSTIYNIEVTPLKKQLELKDDLIHTLQNQNKSIESDKQFLFDHIKHLEEHIPKKQKWFQKRKK